MDDHTQTVVSGLTVGAIRAFILNHLSSVNLLVAAESLQQAADRTFRSNAEFWQAVLSADAPPLSWIELPSYQVCDWFPRSPGLFHTREAQWQRELAQRHLVNENGVLHYLPHGKSDMIAGGIGSVRFQPLKIEESDHWLCTATSDHYCHSGIPLAIPHALFRSLDVYQPGHFKIVGQLRFLPSFLAERFGHYTHIRQLYLQVSEITRQDEQGYPITVTPMVFFESNGPWGRHSVTYVKCASHVDQELDSAAEWIAGYVDRYGGEILTNFDQQRPTFADVPFSLQAVMTNRIDMGAIESVHIARAEFVRPEINRVFAEKADMSSNITVTLGDGTVIHGDMVVANSIKESFIRAANSDSSDALKETLQQLASAVGKLVEGLDKESAEEVARDLESLTSEATSNKPRRKWWQMSVDGITSAAEKVAGVGKPVLEILAKLKPLLIAAG